MLHRTFSSLTAFINRPSSTLQTIFYTHTNLNPKNDICFMIHEMPLKQVDYSNCLRSISRLIIFHDYKHYKQQKVNILIAVMTFKSIKYPLISFSKKLEFTYHKFGDYWKLLVENQSIKAMRSKYLRLLSQYRLEKKYITYMDETYLTLGQRDNSTVCNQLEKNFVLKSNEKPQRLIIVHGGGINGFINNALLIFQSDTNGETCHKGMNYEIFSIWMVEKYLPNLPKNSVIIFDNASYHNTQAIRAPSMNSHKRDIMNWLDDKGVSYNPFMLKKDLYAKVLEIKEANKKYKIDEIVENAGHVVLRLPPYHTELNPIEPIWTIAKDSIIKQYLKNKDDDIVQLVNEEFSKITAEDWKKSIIRVQIIERFYTDLDVYLNQNIQNSLFDYSEECVTPFKLT